MRKEYQLKLYKELFPQDTTITENDLELVTLDNVLTIHPYNDLGLLVRGKLIILAEAQSIKSVNIGSLLFPWASSRGGAQSRYEAVPNSSSGM